MATIVTVHGTFAHIDGAPVADEAQWWQRGSKFEAQARELFESQDGVIEFLPFVWSGDNSEVVRREAATRLLELLRSLDERNERYCVIGHSHGGSIISSALVESVVHGRPLKGLKRWITVGTPFIGMRKEPFLFSRLNLLQRTMFVASLMLLMMFVFFAAGQILGSGPDAAQRGSRLPVLLFSGLMMSLPFVVFLMILKYLDRRQLYFYRAKWIKRAREAYGPSWLQLCHGDDEAVHGLKTLPQVHLDLVDRDFATTTLSMGAIFSLPVLYLLVVTSPPVMVGIADLLKTHVYSVEDFKSEGPMAAESKELEAMVRRLREARRVAEGGGLDQGRVLDAQAEVKSLRPRVRELRNKLEESYPEFASYERARRFKRRFFEENGQPCPNEQLCGEGKDFRVNTRLLYHVATDELSNAVVGDEFDGRPIGGLLRLLVPIVLVPAISVLVAVLILMAAGAVARRISSLASWYLNRTTLAEIKRSAFGNDTEGEIAIGADRYPFWLGSGMSYLPDELGDLIAAYSNTMTAETLSKFRKAISTLVFTEGESKASMISAYFTWKELIHATYFDVPEFRKLVAHAISRADGFSPTQAFLADPDYMRTGDWLSVIEKRPDPAPAS